MDERELDNFLTSRGANADCPFCGHDHWAQIRLERGSTLRIPGLTADDESYTGIRVVGLACVKCGFVRLHAQDVVTDKLTYLPDEADSPPASEDESGE